MKPESLKILTPNSCIHPTFKLFIVKEDLNDKEYLMVNVKDETETVVVYKDAFKVQREKPKFNFLNEL